MHGRPGLSLVPAATGMILGSGAGAHLTAKHGGRITVAAGTLFAAAGLTVQGGYLDGVSYWPTGVGLLLFGLGAGIAMPSASDLIMATLPPARAGVGSAVNDTVRELAARSVSRSSAASLRPATPRPSAPTSSDFPASRLRCTRP
ncbi:MAG: hypothetical protein ACXVLO_03610 [Acidimicrobiia bacterium]